MKDWLRVTVICPNKELTHTFKCDNFRTSDDERNLLFRDEHGRTLAIVPRDWAVFIDYRTHNKAS